MTGASSSRASARRERVLAEPGSRSPRDDSARTWSSFAGESGRLQDLGQRHGVITTAKPDDVREQLDGFSPGVRFSPQQRQTKS